MNGNWVFPKNVLMRYILCVMNVNNLKDIYPQNNIRSQQPYLQCLSHAHKSTPLSTTRLSVFLPKSLTSADGRLIVHGLRVANIDMIMFVDSCLFFKLTLQKNGEQNEVSLELLVPKKKVPSISCFSNHRLTNPPPTWLLRKMLHSPLIRLVLLLRMIVFTTFRGFGGLAPSEVVIVPKEKLTGVSKAEEEHCQMLGQFLYTAKRFGKREGLLNRGF